MHLVRAGEFKVGGCRLPVSTMHTRSFAGMGRMMCVSRAAPRRVVCATDIGLSAIFLLEFRKPAGPL